VTEISIRTYLHWVYLWEKCFRSNLAPKMRIPLNMSHIVRMGMAQYDYGQHTAE